MTATPWGPGAELRARQLPRGRGGDPEARARQQRDRLLGATVVAVSEQGYESTSVADLIRLAGVSRSSFYRHFDDKRDCVMATYDTLMDGALAATATAFEREGPWDERLAGAFSALAELIAAYPAAAHVCLVDIFATGADAVDHAERATAGFERLLSRALAESPEREGLPQPVIEAILGGALKVIAARVRGGRAQELPGLLPEFATWALAYLTPPGAIRRPRPKAQPTGGGVQFGPYGDAGRFLEALVAEVSDRGYGAVTIDGIAARAGASAHTFYKHYTGRQDALAAAYDAGLAQAYAFTQPALQHVSDWPHGFKAAIDALFAFLAASPAWTEMVILESPAAGPEMLRRNDAAIDHFATLLRPGFEFAPEFGEVAVEATAGAVWALHLAHIRRVGAARLPEIAPACVYVGLAPFIGAERALAVANERGRQRRPRPSAAGV